MLIGAAARLTTGQAIGIDLWQNEDQAENTPDATLENARRAGVSAGISVQTADARALPFVDGQFDMVMSHWVVHNVSDAGDRMRVLDEMLRVLRPGGALLLADIAYLADYQSHLTANGLTDIQTDTGGLEALIVGALSGGTFRPQFLVGRQ